MRKSLERSSSAIKRRYFVHVVSIAWGILALIVLLCSGTSGWANDSSNPDDPPVTSPGSADAQGLHALPTYAIDSPYNAQQPVGIRFHPYNTGNVELDLWQIENKKFLRSDAVISPDRHHMAYSEVMFLPNNRQTFSRLFLVPLPTKPPPAERQQLPEEYYAAQREKMEKAKAEKKAQRWWKTRWGKPPEPTPDEIANVALYHPDMHLSERQTLLSVGQHRSESYLFETLTVVDWSASGRRLLFKRRSGVLYTGLKTSDILVYDREKGTITLYSELQEVVSHFWDRQGTLPKLRSLAWDIYPMGWLPESESVLIFKAWAFDKRERQFLGLWQYDIDSQQSRLIDLKDHSIPVAANGVVAESDVVYDPQTGLWARKGQTP